MKKDWIPPVAGVLEIVAAICAFIGSGLVVFSGVVVNTIPDIDNDPNFPQELVTALLMTIACVLLVFAVVSLIGGISALRRRAWPWAVAGAISALFTTPPFGIFALVLVMVGEGEFSGRSSGTGELDEPMT